jgi:hypothetical protein
MGFIRKSANLAMNGSSTGIPSAHCLTSLLSYHLDKISQLIGSEWFFCRNLICPLLDFPTVLSFENKVSKGRFFRYLGKGFFKVEERFLRKMEL